MTTPTVRVRPSPSTASFTPLHALLATVASYYKAKACADSCQPCPLNGRCVDGELECVQGFKRQDKACIEDGLLSQTANKIVMHFPCLSLSLSLSYNKSHAYLLTLYCTRRLVPSPLQIKSELLQLWICNQHARALCGQPAEILVCFHLLFYLTSWLSCPDLF
jgi:hypothetical protein